MKDFELQKNVVYLDTAATSQKPIRVVTAMNLYYKESANVHRGLHKLSQKATKKFEASRTLLKEWFGSEQIVFTKNATEAINLVAYGMEQLIDETSNIVTTVLEHHSNFVPWQQLALRKKAEFRVAGIKNEDLDYEDLLNKIDENTKVVAITLMSNVLGKEITLKRIIPEIKKKTDAIIIIDAVQVAAHSEISLKELNVDFLVVSAHKMYGPTGVGLLAAKTESLKSLNKFLYGGDMIKTVTKETTDFNELPYCFEAGTPPIAEVIGFGEAIKYLKENFEAIKFNEKNLMEQLLKELKKIPEIVILGSSQLSLISFTTKGIHPHDVASIMDENNVCVRAGFHCAEPLHKELNVTGSVRISLGAHNTKEDIDNAINAINKVIKVFK